MTFKELQQRVTSALQGYSGLAVGVTQGEILSAINNAQQYVAADLLLYCMRLAQPDTEDNATQVNVLQLLKFGYWDWLDSPWPLTQPQDSKVDTDWSAILLNIPPMLADGTQEPVVPFYIHDALCTRAVITLAPKYGDQKESPRLLDRLDANYSREIAHARRTAVLLMENRPFRVEDANDPTRFIRQEW